MDVSWTSAWVHIVNEALTAISFGEYSGDELALI
jgi:hypothetical protein